MCTLHLIVSFEEGKKRRIYSTLFEKLLLNVRTMVQGPSVYVLPEPDVVWMYMTSAKISRIKNFANVGITAKSAKISRYTVGLGMLGKVHCEFLAQLIA